jgi:small basic protein
MGLLAALDSGVLRNQRPQPAQIQLDIFLSGFPGNAVIALFLT